MRKLTVFGYVIFLYFFIFNSASALTPLPIGKIDKNFSSECYEYYAKIDKQNLKEYTVINLSLDKSPNIILQDDYILPYKGYNQNRINYTYVFEEYASNSSDIPAPYGYLSDDNVKTFWNMQISHNKEINLIFDVAIKDFDFDFFTSIEKFEIKYLLEIGGEFKEIEEDNLEDFTFDFLKIRFVSKNNNQNIVENAFISELNFYDNRKSILVKSYLDADMEIFGNYNCKENYFPKIKGKNNFSVDKDTKLLEVNFINNEEYNVLNKKDYDKDGIFDDEDNCKYLINPLQKDSNSDGKGDICMDDDNDGVYGNKDNCVNLYNPLQEDININGVGDKCEFDKDEDTIFDEIDNCINTINPNQIDTDRDGIGDICDNCKSFNPRQIDKDLNMIGDVCDEEKITLEENDIDKDSIIDWNDNCKEISNTDQLDFDKDGIGDSCDNCRELRNKKQLDLDNNGIGDMCEDSDNDSIEGYLDNCINIANSDQKDDDNNGIGNLCEDKDNDKILFANDNCPFDYNPEQKDIDKDNIGDKCDDEDNRFIESNKWVFIGFLAFVSLIFGALIFLMIHKLNKKA